MTDRAGWPGVSAVVMVGGAARANAKLDGVGERPAMVTGGSRVVRSTSLEEACCMARSRSVERRAWGARRDFSCTHDMKTGNLGGKKDVPLERLLVTVV